MKPAILACVLFSSLAPEATCEWHQAAVYSASPEAEITVEREPLADGRERLTAYATVQSGGLGLTYVFRTVHEGASGRSVSEQRGAAEALEPLAVSVVDVDEGDVFTAHLAVYRRGRQVSSARWRRADP